MKKNNKDSKERFDSKASTEANLDFQVLNREQEEIIAWIEKVKFRKQLVSGVNEQDVWKKIHELNEMYEAALRAERIRYNALLDHQKKKDESKPHIDQHREESSSYE